MNQKTIDALMKIKKRRDAIKTLQENPIPINEAKAEIMKMDEYDTAEKHNLVSSLNDAHSQKMVGDEIVKSFQESKAEHEKQGVYLIKDSVYKQMSSEDRG